ncbi:hypothetical protein Shyhy01_61420 [Streptomyces hygroscopicus subsp. hygroscopicus]|nr:hypothetical protein Shyhy01_61420 [Streptomyces hygroscopicus subsp. hygroscopicus]
MPRAKLSEPRRRRVRAAPAAEVAERPEEGHVRSDGATGNPVPAPPFPSGRGDGTRTGDS